MIETPKDGRIQVEKLKYPVEVLAYKLWLDPELVSRVDLKRIYTCQLYASNSAKYVSTLFTRQSCQDCVGVRGLIRASHS